MNQTWENGKKLILGPILACFVGFIPTISWTLFQAIRLCNLQEN